MNIIVINNETNRKFARFLQKTGGKNTITEYWNRFVLESGAEMTPEIKRLVDEYIGYGNPVCNSSELVIAVICESGGKRV